MPVIQILNDEMTSPTGKGPYFSNPDYTSRIFDMSLAELATSLLEDMTKFEADQTGCPRKTLQEARQWTDFHNHPDVVEDWENSNQEPDDYEGPEWFYGALASFVFSIKCLYGTYKFLKQTYPDFSPKTIVDWGAGLGMHSIICATLWPESKVYYYNLPGLQTKFVKNVLKPGYGVDNVIIKTKREKLPSKADLILSFEVLEHMKEPTVAAEDLLKLDPEFIAVSFSFTAPCRGHFTYFDVGDYQIPREEVTRYVNDVFRTKYKAVGHGWNARPVVWKRDEKR